MPTPSAAALPASLGALPPIFPAQPLTLLNYYIIVYFPVGGTAQHLPVLSESETQSCPTHSSVVFLLHSHLHLLTL